MTYRGKHEGAVGVMAKLPADLHAVAGQRLADERLSWQELVAYAVAAYAVGDLEVPAPADVEQVMRRAGVAS